MKHLTVLFVFLFLNTFPAFAQEAEEPVTSCNVNSVHSGTGVAYIYLINCKGPFGFKKKEIALKYHVLKKIEDKRPDATYINTVDTTSDMLAMKTTAELGYLFNKPVWIQLENKDQVVPTFMSLAESVDLKPVNNGDWKPVPPPAPRNH